MTDTTTGSLRELQKLDDRIREINAEVGAFDERLAEAEDPAVELEGELSRVRERLAQMNSDARRLERAADDKRARAERMEQRLTQVSNLREEAAVRTELDLIRKAIEGDEQEALGLMDQIRRMEVAEEELDESATEARELVVARQESIHEDRRLFTERLEKLQARRAEVLEHVDPDERRVYEAFHRSGREVVVAPLLEDGACGNCFGMIPLQLRNEIRQGDGIFRCEACGVILTTEPEPILDEALVAPIEVSSGTEADEDGAEAEDESVAEAGEGPTAEAEGEPATEDEESKET